MNPQVYIVDTNVLVAGLLTAKPDAPTAAILDSMLEGRLLYLLSPDLLNEYKVVLLRPGIVRYHGLSEAEIDQLLAEITANCIWREPASEGLYRSPDPKDAHLWALLDVEPRAVLITGDRLILEQPGPERSIISPAAWLVLMAK